MAIDHWTEATGGRGNGSNGIRILFWEYHRSLETSSQVFFRCRYMLSVDNVFFFHVVFKAYSTPEGQTSHSGAFPSFAEPSYLVLIQ